MKPTPSDPRSPKAVWDQQHEFALNDPLMWQLKADSLAAAFDVLIEDDIRRKLESARARRIPSVEYMLAGFALENLLKGQLIARHKHRDETGAFKLKTHDLRQLARDAGYEMSEPENRLLEKIQEFATWTARYPVPKIMRLELESARLVTMLVTSDQLTF